ncbi:MAG: cytochrome c maturation protein CcmE [Pseudomonadota bacterium]
MKPANRNRRIGLIAAGFVLLAGAAGLVAKALEQNIAYFYTPSEAAEASLAPETRIRLGGMVEDGSVESRDGIETIFRVTDGAQSITVAYSGILPDLFREGQGVIAQGRLQADGSFTADTILAKHDENYIPKELIDVMDQAKAGS